jgi:Right handed beta helix region
MKTKILAGVAFISFFCLTAIDASGLTANQVETNIRSVTTGCPDFTVAAPTAGTTVSASSFNVSPGNSAGLNYTNFSNAIAYCKTHTPCTLIVAPGTYHIGDRHYSSGILNFNGMTNFTFDGQGSTFLMESKSYFVLVQNSSHIALQNMTVGWNWNIENVQSLAQVNAIDPSGNYIDLLYPYESNPSVSAPIPADFVEVDNTNYNFARQGLGVIGVWQMDLTKTVKVAPNIIRFFDDTGVVGTGWFNNNNHTHVGQYYLIRHYEYDFHGFETTTSDNLTFSNLTVYSTLGMGFHFHENKYCQVINSRLIREPGSLYHLSGSADGINVGNSFGYFKVQNVEIGNTGDDAINIHDTLSEGVKVTGANSLTVSNVIDWQNPFHVGDTVELRARDFSLLSPPWSSTVTAVGAYNNGAGTVPLTFTSALPGSLDVNTIVFNDHYNSGNYLVSDCYIHDNKVRGMVVHNGNGTIEGNQFARNYDPGLFLVCLATKYSEGCNPSNVVIRGNFFDGNDIKRNDFLSMPNEVVIAGETAPSGIVSYPICKNIIFENNLVRNCPYAALEISSATNVLADNNTFESPYRVNDNSSVLGCVVVQKSSEVVMNNNHLVLDAGLTSYKTNIYQDATATTDVYLDAFIPDTLPSSWTTWDVGGVDLSGSAAYTNGSYTIKGSGADIWSTHDSFQFVYQPWSGDGQIIARVTGVQNTSPWAKAALMFRETLDDDSRNGIICLTPGNGVSMQSRTNTTGPTATVNTVPGTAPKWISLLRLGNVLYGYESSDAVNWTPVGTNTVSMATDAYIGLAVTSKSNTVLNTSTFDHVTVGGAWLSQDIGSVGVAGGSQINYSNGAVTVQGSGTDIWGNSDSFRFLYQTCSGDSTIIARVTSVQNTSPWAKAAVMIRESLSADSRNTTLFLSPSNAVSLQGRILTSGVSTTVSNLYSLPAPRWIKLVRSSANLNAYQSPDGINWTWVGTQTNGIASSCYIGLAVTSKSNSVLNTSTFDNVSVQSAWKSGDIGTVAVTGSAGIDDATGTFTISGAGVDIWSTNDAFQFVDQPLHGNGQIVARVVNVQNTSDWAKAGVMIRDTESANSINALLFISPTNGISFQGRASTGNNTSTFATASGVAPYWLKLVRNGSTVTAYTSSSGTSWTQVGSPQTIAMSTNAWIGLAVGSKDNILLNTSVFDNVTVTPAP